MTCPICGEKILKNISVRHLPNFYRCPNCSGYYHREKESPAYEASYFSEEQKPSFLGVWITNFLDLFFWVYEKKIKNLLGSKDAWILDYGCGKGKLLSFLKKRGFNIEGYDPSGSAVALAQGANLPVFKEIPDRKYDLVMFWHSLEHTDQPLKDLEQLKNHLNPGAKLLIAVPNGDSLEAYWGGENWFCYDWPFHRVHFNETSLKKMLGKSGFEAVSADYWNLSYTLSSLAQTFLNFILPKNLLYSAVSNRRMEHGKMGTILGSAASLLILLVFSKLLFLIFIFEILTKKTAALIVTARKIS